jgi:phosphoglycerate dehydrogenase-like enzyme
MFVCGFLLLLAGCDKSSEHPQPASETAQATAQQSPAVVAADVPLKIVVKRAALTQEQQRQLESAAPGLRVVFVDNQDPGPAQLKEIVDADALLTDWLTPELVRAGKKLRWIQHYAAGVDELMFPELVNSGIVLTNAKIIQGPQIADHGFALLLALTRRLNEIIPAKRKERLDMGYYRQRENWPIELQGRTALIIGVGGIGMQLAQRAHAFGMQVIGLDPKDVPYTYFFQTVAKPDRLDELLPRADVVFMTAPLTPETAHMLGPRQFSAMKRGSYFIALSRAGTYDSDALVQALRENRLAGAGLDVVEAVPLPSKHPLLGFENVIVTPHMSGQSDRVWDRRFELLRENMQRFAQAKPLLNVVDKTKGY